MFNSVPKAEDKKTEIEIKPDVKSPPSTKNDEKKEQPKATPKVSTPAVAKKTPSGKVKGNIASFFNSKPSASTKKIETIPRTEKTPEREIATVKIDSSEEDIQKSPDVPKQQIKKKTKLKAKKTVNNKRSRIMQMEDSSDEDKEKGKNIFFYILCIL